MVAESGQWRLESEGLGRCVCGNPEVYRGVTVKKVAGLERQVFGWVVVKKR
jgi:hypothetical protein